MLRLFIMTAIVLGSFWAARDAGATMEAEPVTTLQGSEWGPENGLQQFIAFKPNGEFFGFAGCNSIFGTYEQSGDTLKLGPIASTKRACPDMGGAEGAFISALENTRAFKATHTDIELFDENEELLMSMRRRDWD